MWKCENLKMEGHTRIKTADDIRRLQNIHTKPKTIHPIAWFLQELRLRFRISVQLFIISKTIQRTVQL